MTTTHACPEGLPRVHAGTMSARMLWCRPPPAWLRLLSAFRNTAIAAGTGPSLGLQDTQKCGHHKPFENPSAGALEPQGTARPRGE